MAHSGTLDIMIGTLFALHKELFPKLGAQGYYPPPQWLRTYWHVTRKSPSTQRVQYARLMKGMDLSFVAPDEYGCQESVSRIDNILFGDKIFTYTRYALDYYLNSDKWMEVSIPVQGCTVIAATETGRYKGDVGHVGIFDRGRIWSNNSESGVWDNVFTLMSFKERYNLKFGMPVRYFVKLR